MNYEGSGEPEERLPNLEELLFVGQRERTAQVGQLHLMFLLQLQTKWIQILLHIVWSNQNVTAGLVELGA